MRIRLRRFAAIFCVLLGLAAITAGQTAPGRRLAFIDLNQLRYYYVPVTVVRNMPTRRVRRQAYPPNPAPFQPRVEDYNLPPHYQPLPGRDASSLSPIFPMTSTFNNGLDVNPGQRVTVEGNLNVPILGWGVWDYRGGVRAGRANTRVGFGSLAAPTNIFGITPETIETLATDELFNKARDKTPSIPVAVLPGNFVPVRCKPPFCNPFVHNTAFGVDVEPGDDALFDGGIDFPMPLAPGGVGVRLPVSGGVSVGTDPLVITYGHGMGPVEPPNFKSGTDRIGGGKRPLPLTNPRNAEIDERHNADDVFGNDNDDGDESRRRR